MAKKCNFHFVDTPGIFIFAKLLIRNEGKSFVLRHNINPSETFCNEGKSFVLRHNISDINIITDEDPGLGSKSLQ